MTSDLILVTANKRKEIKDTILTVLCDCNIHTLPVNLKNIIARRGDVVLLNSLEAKQLKMIDNDYYDYDGETVCFNKMYYIIFNIKHPKVRQRWTVAHELGHIFLYHSEWSRLNEAQANYFAKNLLEPIAVLEDMNALTVESISKVCCVSREAAAIRIKDLKKHLLDKAKHGLSNQDKRFLQIFNRLDAFIQFCPAM